MSEGTWLVGTAGQAVVRSNDQGLTWHRLGLGQPLKFDAVVRSVCLDPSEHRRVYAGTDIGLCVSQDLGNTWEQLQTPFNGQTVWKVLVDPRDSARIFVGTGAPSRAVLWRTLDGGRNWGRAAVEIPEFCAGVNRPRLLAFAFDPVDPLQLWFGLEEGGLFHSRDGGTQWERVDSRLLWPFRSDIHNIQVLPNHGNKVVVVACVNAVYRSFDEGKTWSGFLPNDTHGLYYARALSAPPGTESTLYLSLSDGTPGTTSRILRSDDAGAHWEVLPLPQQPNSCFWTIAMDPSDPRRVLAGTKYGHLFTSVDGGHSWQKQWREFSEITEVAWSPVVAEIQVAHRSVVAREEAVA